MRDSIVLESFTDPVTGVIYERTQTSADIVAEHGLPPELWSARHPNGGIYGMGVGPTTAAAFAMLLRKFPELAERRAA